MVFFKFEEDIPCQYDPLGIIQEKIKKLKLGVYEHKGTIEISKLENKLIFSDEGESDSKDIEIIESLDMVIVQEKGKRPLEQEEILPTTKKKKIRKLNL